MSGPGAHRPQGQHSHRPGLGAARVAVEHLAFGRRLLSPERELSLRRARLEMLAAELELLFAHRLEAAEPFCVFSDQGEPSLVIGEAAGLSLTVEIEPEKGLFVLYEGGPRMSATLTSSEARLIDLVVSALAAPPGDDARRSADAATDALVGHSLEDVKKRLILRTLLHFRGDRRKTAAALGLDEGMLRLRLRHYWLAKPQHRNATEIDR